MDFIYPYVQIIHIIFAIIFLGYIFFDTVILNMALKNTNKDEAQKIKKLISLSAIKIMPIALFFIILTGGMMMNRYLFNTQGWFETNLQKLFIIKIILAMLILIGVILNLSRKFLHKQPFAFMKNFHYFVLICGFFIVLLAKLMFLF